MNAASGLVDHFFRHEHGRLVALLVRQFGPRRIDLIEDVVQTTFTRALATWSRQGPPEQPAAWLFRVARNLAIDALRRESVHNEALQSQAGCAEHDAESHDVAETCFESEIGDAPLRLLFLCCHPAVPPESRVAFALRTVCGFGVREIAAGLLTTPDNAEKRISRARERLRDETSAIVAELSADDVGQRLETVLSTVYLIFNEGFAATGGNQVIRNDLCDEAVRLARMLCAHPVCQTPAAHALLALFLFHSGRFDSRVDGKGIAVLLEDQDRSRWDWSSIREAMALMARAATGESLSRYHLEAAIAWEHCRATDFAQTDWTRVTELYETLCSCFATPMARLNHAIALSYSAGIDSGIVQLLAIPDADRRRLRPWWDCAMAQLHSRGGRHECSQSHWRDAMALAQSPAQQRFIRERLERGMP